MEVNTDVLLGIGLGLALALIIVISIAIQRVGDDGPDDDFPDM